MGLTGPQRYNIKMDAIFKGAIVLKHEIWNEYTDDEYNKAKNEYFALKLRYPNLLRDL